MAELEAAYPPHEREARTKGIPSLGRGAIYPVADADIVCKPFEIPAYYKQAYALDVGWNVTAAIWGALDPESDVLYLYSEHYRSEAEPPIHAAAIKARGEWIPGVIDPASRGRGQADGESLFQQYQLMLKTLSLANNAVESGLYEVWTRMSTGRLKAFDNLQHFWEEKRLYRRDEKGKVVKDGDHVMDCVRYLVMSGIHRAIGRPHIMWPEVGKNKRHQFEYNPMAEFYKVKP